MSCRRLSHHHPRPSGASRLLPVLLATAGLGVASACSAEPQGVHTHSIELAAGDFVRAVVRQRKDVLVELVDPEGREVLHVDGPNSIFDDEEIAAVAERPGLYELRVRNCPPDAPAAECYTLRLDPPRPATGEDHRRAEAVRTTQDAVDAMARHLQGQGDTRAEQIDLRKKALGLWRALGDRRREAEELYQLGMVRQRLQQVEPAAGLLHEAAAIYAGLGDPVREAKALNEAGKTCEEKCPGQAVEDFRKALVKAQEAEDQRLLQSIYNNLGVRLSYIGEHREALEHLQRAFALARKRGGDGEANVLNNLGLAYSGLGETQEAIKLHKQALAIPNASALDRAAAYNNLGTVHAALGSLEEAIESFHQAIAINRERGDRYLLASTLNNLGLTQHYAGNTEGARVSYEEALALAGQTGNLSVQIQAANNYGILLDQELGRTVEALGKWREVIRLTAEHPVLDYVGLAAEAAVARGEKKLAEARGIIRQAIARSRSKAEDRFAADLTLRLARLERDLEDLPAAEKSARDAIEMIESQRNRVVSPEQRALFLASNQTFYETHIRILMELDRQRPGEGYASHALTVSEQARARSLLDLLAEADLDLRRGVPPEILADEQKKRARLRELDSRHMELIHRGASQDQIDRANEELRRAVDELKDVETGLRESSGSYAALTAQPLNVREIQTQVLGDRALLLEYALGEEKSYLWAVTPEAVKSFELPPRQEIEDAARDFYDAVTALDRSGASLRPASFDARAERAGHELSRLILGPVERLLGDRILLVVGDGVLQYVPFAALPLPSTSGERVLAHNEVVSLPSASTLAALRLQIEGRPAAPKTLAVLADPVFEGDPRLLRIQPLKNRQPPLTAKRQPSRGTGDEADQLLLVSLPFAAEEARNILALIPDAGQRLAALGFEATYPLAVSGDLGKFRYVHFATHGLLDSRQPNLSKLALSQYRKDGQKLGESFLRLADIYNLDLNADLVTLSACKTALGKEVRGEGLVGLTRGFMYAGAARVLASLWSVEDRATAELMKSFYRHLLVDKRPAAESLRQAQLEMSRKPLYRSPYYWAGFSLQGEWK